MQDLLIVYQRFIMLFLQGICFFIAFLILITKSLCAKRKTAIFLLEVSAVLYVSENTWTQTKDFILFEGPVSVEVEGKGKLCCYFVKGIK